MRDRSIFLPAENSEISGNLDVSYKGGRRSSLSVRDVCLCSPLPPLRPCRRQRTHYHRLSLSRADQQEQPSDRSQRAPPRRVLRLRRAARSSRSAWLPCPRHPAPRNRTCSSRSLRSTTCFVLPRRHQSLSRSGHWRHLGWDRRPSRSPQHCLRHRDGLSAARLGSPQVLRCPVLLVEDWRA